MKSELDFLYERQLQTRIRIAYFVAIFVFSLLFLRLWFLQVVYGKNYRDLSENNRIRTQKVKAPRGFILDSSGRILASNRPSFDISLVPQDTRELDRVLSRLSELLGEETSVLKQKVEQARGRPPFESIKLQTDVTREVLGLVLTHKLDLPGVVVESTPVRSYPYGALASHVLGHMGEISQKELERFKDLKNIEQYKTKQYKIGDFVGKSGVEQEKEALLTGEDGGYQSEVNAVGYKINIMGRLDPIPGHNVMLTINAELQKTAEKELKGKVGAIVAVDPRNGKILTMASSPSFDPNLFSLGISAKDWDELINNPDHPLMNRCIQAVHPPGSTYKLVTAAAAMEERLITEETHFYCSGIFKLGNRSYRCWKRPGHRKVSLVKGIAESCDVYFYQLGVLLGPDLLAGYAKGFGFGAPTGISLKNEKSGFIPTSDWYRKRYGMPWQTGESLSIAIGQGSNLITPLQLVMAYAAMANGGWLYKPYCIDRVVTVEGEVKESTGPERRGSVPLSVENRALLMKSLWEVVNTPVGTGTLASIPEKDVSGKTGTAQVVSLAKKKENADQDTFSDHAWFAAYAPGDEARIAIVVFIEHGGHGGSAAAPIARVVISRFFELEEEGNV